MLSSENPSQNVPLLTPKLHYGEIFQPAIPKAWQDCFYQTLYLNIGFHDYENQDDNSHYTEDTLILNWIIKSGC